VAFLKSLRLEAALDEAATDDLETVLDELLRWYADAERAARARVFAWRHGLGGGEELYSSKTFQEFTAVLQRWVKQPLPSLEGEALVSYAADSLLIAAHHSDDADASPQLMSVEGDCGTLFLLRSARDRAQQPADEAWALGTLHSPDTEAALEGIYRFKGCTPAFADHAVECARCQAQLQQWEASADLPDGFEQFRRQPLRPSPPETPPLPAAARVGITHKAVIEFPPPVETEPPPKKQWWKFW
jgi:hypothetical protein